MSLFREILAGVTLTLKGSRSASSMAVERKFAKEALAKIKAGKPLDDGGESLAVIRILEQTLEGYDARKGLEIAPKAGRPQIMAGHHAFLAAHYWSLRELDPLEKVAASQVAELWGITPGGVRTIASENKEKAVALLAQMTADEIAQISSMCAELR